MKLYGTITSERASKGQGGQKYLEGSISIGEDWRNIPSQEEIWWKAIWQNADTDKPSFSLKIPQDWEITTTKEPDGGTFLLAHKGKKQKGDKQLVCNNSKHESYKHTKGCFQ